MGSVKSQADPRRSNVVHVSLEAVQTTHTVGGGIPHALDGDNLSFSV